MERSGHLAARLRIPCALAALMLLSGCSISRTLLSLDSGYEKTRLPVYRDDAWYEDDRYVSVAVGGRQQDAFAFTDENGAPISVRHGIRSVDVSLWLESEVFHFGLQVGASPTDKGLLRVGTYGGGQFDVAPYLAASLTSGLFVNNNANRVRYEHSETILFFPSLPEEDSARGNMSRLEVPLRVNLIVDTETGLSPFVSYSYNRIGIGVRKAGAVVVGHELAAGTLIDLPRGFGIRVEGAVSRDGIVDRKAAQGRRATEPVLGLYMAAVQRF